MLEKIQSPADLKKLSQDQLEEVVVEARQALLEKTSHHGGHNGPNFGVVEMTVALHYVFDSPRDKFIFDVSHQSYVHKMLTGRAQAFLDPDHYDDVSGYTNPRESEHDLFTIGHTSTSLALASGVAKARDLKGQKSNVVAIIGDGSLSGGQAYEGLNQIATTGTNTIVIVNDNDQSIAVNPKGGIYTALRTLRETNGQAQDNLFKALGFDYYYLDKGNDLASLIALFQEVKDSDHPVLLHIHTQKGHGVTFMEENREAFHAGGPFNPETGQYLRGNSGPNYNSITGDFLLKKMKEDPTVIAVNAGTPMFLFSQEQRQEAGQQFVDVGIAEQEAATMSTGLAKNGAKPVWYVASTFMQRTYDQWWHDIALNNQSVTVLVHSASVNAMNDESHLGFFDIPFLSHIPNVVYLAPTNKEENLAMLDWAIEQKDHPVAIRVPVGPLKETGQPDQTDYSILNKNQVTQEGSQVAIFGLGNFYGLAQEVAKTLEDQHGIKATLVNPKFITGLDKGLLDSLSAKHQLVVTLEDGLLEGGYGQTIASYLGNTDIKVQNYGIDKHFHDRYDRQELMAKNGLSVDTIVKNILQTLAN
ncbi:putative 1-deoxy-D-xylulose-5-phosphate synthase [Streptococcus downei F0415]|uniref:1-deoxy-D-xylulose-5-phosphate synthase n=1 Tax=Streptococcus downei TaxID=1317 RepID=UPI0001E98F41|nr:1-deoxy-D-xylulose-5-phosphate synthase [Streptococcus downei]EFQ56773.1 putative 1-deoxy-D-xylulose-5-phosphate synthase [Streptococcus downei F0415]